MCTNRAVLNLHLCWALPLVRVAKWYVVKPTHMSDTSPFVCTNCDLLKVKFTLEGVTKAQTGGRGIAQLFLLTSTLEGVGLSTPRPSRFNPATYCTGGQVASSADIEGCRKSRHHQVSIPRPIRPYPATIPTRLCRSTALLDLRVYIVTSPSPINAVYLCDYVVCYIK
jgi:hypothetical protein